MFQQIDRTGSNPKTKLWQYSWSDGSRLELTETFDNFVLIEYGPDNDPIPYMLPGDSGKSSIEERYPKRRWKLHNVIEDIKQEYEIKG